jgi:hypothetical protein
MELLDYTPPLMLLDYVTTRLTVGRAMADSGGQRPR